MDKDFSRGLTQALGQELRRARDDLGLTRAELIALLPFELHTKTLQGYEQGFIQCTVTRYVQICTALGVPASEMLSQATHSEPAAGRRKGNKGTELQHLLADVVKLQTQAAAIAQRLDRFVTAMR